MPVIYMINKQRSLEREPYASFGKAFEDLDMGNGEIVIPISGKEGEILNGFYCGGDYTYREIKFNYKKVDSNEFLGTDDEVEEQYVFVRGSFSFDYEAENLLDYRIRRLKAFINRADYYYIPKAEYVEFSYSLNNNINMYIDVIARKSDIQEVCYSMMNQFITIFTLED